jgi:hypothetical protein
MVANGGGAQHGIGVSRQLGNDRASRGHLIAGLEVSYPQCLFDRIDQLQIRGYSRLGI